MMFNISEKNKDKCGIYKIRNIVDNKVYVGQTTEGFYNRWLRHSNLLKNNKHFNPHLQKAYNKYGSDNFEISIVEVCSDLLAIAELEEKYIAEYRIKYGCYNCLSGGPTMNGSNNPFFGRKHSKESLEKISASRVGKCVGAENSFYGKDHSGKNNGFYGRSHTQESKNKMSETKSKMYSGKGNPFYGKHHSQEALEKMKNNGKNAMRKVICVETGTIYNSIKEAAEKTNTCARSISAVCNGSRNVANGLHWKHMSKRDESL